MINLFKWRETKKNKYLYFLFITVALGVQAHLLVALHALTALFFILKKLKRHLVVISLSCLILLFFVALFILSEQFKENSFVHLFKKTGIFWSCFESFKYKAIYVYGVPLVLLSF